MNDQRAAELLAYVSQARWESKKRIQVIPQELARLDELERQIKSLRAQNGR